MKRLTTQERDRLWKQVCADFPDDRVMQDVHYARLVHKEMLRGETSEGRIAFYHEGAQKILRQFAAKKHGTRSKQGSGANGCKKGARIKSVSRTMKTGLVRIRLYESLRQVDNIGDNQGGCSHTEGRKEDGQRAG